MVFKTRIPSERNITGQCSLFIIDEMKDGLKNFALRQSFLTVYENVVVKRFCSLGRYNTRKIPEPHAECPLSLGNGRSPYGHTNQRLQIQFRAPDNERCAARNMLSLEKTLE